jgi:hypothetical protein
MIKKEDVVELAGGIRLRINSQCFEGDETCEVMLTFDGDLIPIHIELMQFAPPKGPDTRHDVLILASAFSGLHKLEMQTAAPTRESSLCTYCGGYRNAPVHDPNQSGVGVADHEFNYDPNKFQVKGVVTGRAYSDSTHITDIPGDDLVT